MITEYTNDYFDFCHQVLARARREHQYEMKANRVSTITSGLATGSFERPASLNSITNTANTNALWRLPTVLAHIPISRSGWWAGVKTGRYPAPVRISARCVAWKSEDIRALINSL